MRNWIVLFVIGAALLAMGCSGRKQMIKQLTTLEAELTEVAFEGQGVEEAAKYLEKVRAFADKYPNDTLSATYLFRAFGVARGLRDYAKAASFTEEIWTEYPSTAVAPEALFMTGFMYDTDAKDMENARKYYQLFLDKYPTHALSANAKDFLGLTEKDPLEMVEEFEKDSVQMDAEVEVQ
jgi:outer membrane protein assembly factor BamD (BamD/ComL family)